MRAQGILLVLVGAALLFLVSFGIAAGVSSRKNISVVCAMPYATLHNFANPLLALNALKKQSRPYGFRTRLKPSGSLVVSVSELHSREPQLYARDSYKILRMIGASPRLFCDAKATISSVTVFPTARYAAQNSFTTSLVQGAKLAAGPKIVYMVK